MPANSREEAALGAIYGALAGDAAGAPLEFLGRKPTETEVSRALEMPGGGVHQVAPGQITDDGELTLCLAHALAEAPEFNIETIARWYAKWIDSTPFDIGNTIGQTIGSVLTQSTPSHDQPSTTGSYAEQMILSAEQYSSTSKANGALMRAVPLGIWGWNTTTDELAACARREASFSHTHQSCRDASACYSIALASLVAFPGDHVRAFTEAFRWAETEAVSEVQEWMNLAANNIDTPYYPLAGFVKIGFVHAFRHLFLGTSWYDAVHETLSGGGDTDTNACIVGGLIGGLHGTEGIPVRIREALLNADTSSAVHSRPDFLHPRHVPDLVLCILRS